MDIQAAAYLEGKEAGEAAARERIAELEAQMRTWLTDYAGEDERVIPVPRYQIENLLKR